MACKYRPVKKKSGLQSTSGGSVLYARKNCLAEAIVDVRFKFRSSLQCMQISVYVDGNPNYDGMCRLNSTHTQFYTADSTQADLHVDSFLHRFNLNSTQIRIYIGQTLR